jgi:hypothetical protein
MITLRNNIRKMHEIMIKQKIRENDNIKREHNDYIVT